MLRHFISVKVIEKMELLIKSPLFVPYCLLMYSVWLEAYCNYLHLRGVEPFLYERKSYKLVVYLCDVVWLATLLILCVYVSWHALTITLIFVLMLCPLSYRLLIGKRKSYVIRGLAALFSLIVSAWLVAHWF